MPVYTFEGTHPEAVDTLNLLSILGRDFFKGNKATNGLQIQLDFNRVHMVGSGADYVTLKQKWDAAKSTLKDYTQGDIDGGFFTAPVIFSRLCDPTNEALLAKQNTSESHRHIHDAYIDNKGEPCSFSITVHPNHPEKWMIAIVRNTDKNADAKKVHLLSTVHTLPKKTLGSIVQGAASDVKSVLGGLYNKAKSAVSSQPAASNHPTVPNNIISKKEELEKWLQESLGNPKIYELLKNLFTYSDRKREWEINIAALQTFAIPTNQRSHRRAEVGNRLDFIRATLSNQTILGALQSMEVSRPLDDSKPYSSDDLQNLTPALHKTLDQLTAKLGLVLSRVSPQVDWANLMQDELLTLFSASAQKTVRAQDYNLFLKNKVTSLKNLDRLAMIPQDYSNLLSEEGKKLSNQLIQTLQQMMITKEASQHAQKLARDLKRPRRRPAFQAHKTKLEPICFAYLLDDLAALDKQAKSLTQRKCTVMGKQLRDLHTLLNRNLSMIFSIPYSPLIETRHATELGKNLHQECIAALKHVENQKQLDQHRGVKRILKNLLVSVLLLGVIWLGVVAVRYFFLKKSGKESFLICNPTTDSRRIFKALKQTVDDISIPSDNDIPDRHRELYIPR